MKRALITGVNGMDGSHLADFLLEKGYEVYGMERRTSSPNRTNTSHLEGKITFVNGDLTDQNSLLRCLKESDPQEIYNLGAMSFVGESWNTPEQTGDVNGLGVLRMLEAIREDGEDRKFYQASTSEMFGRMVENPAKETTPFYPRSPYGVSKLYGHWITKNYRESYDMFATSGILFNHESERRGIEFVTRKITDGIARIHLGLQDKIMLGNLDSYRDWGYAPDYCEAMWLMLQQDKPKDYVIATGQQYSVREFVNRCAPKFGLKIEWQGEGLDEVGVDITSGKTIVRVNPKYFRPAEVESLLGDSTLARNELGWKPKRSFQQLVDEMCRINYI